MKHAGLFVGVIHGAVASAALLLVAACGGPPELQGPGEEKVQQVEAVKLAPEPLELADNVTLGPDLAVKPAASGKSPPVSPLDEFTISLSVSDANPWVTRSSTLTATTNKDVGPTPYSIVIFGNKGIVASCARGTTCSFTVTESTLTQDWFNASVQDAAGNLATTPSLDNLRFVTWHGAGYQGVYASPSTTAVAGSSTITSISQYDVGPSPYYTELYDATAGRLLAICGSGTICTAQVSQTISTTHAFRAYFTPYNTAFPPPSPFEHSPDGYVTWGTMGYTLSLSQSAFLTYTATANINVQAPYYIQIFNEDDGRLLASCSAGTQCTVKANLDGHLVAFIKPYSSTLSLAGVQASSNMLPVAYVI